ncbi:MAG: hypothetical protein ACI4MS_00710 [Candidatus Coproplasma sp.]
MNFLVVTQLVRRLGLWDCHSDLQSLRNDGLPHQSPFLVQEASKTRRTRLFDGEFTKCVNDPRKTQSDTVLRSLLDEILSRRIFTERLD